MPRGSKYKPEPDRPSEPKLRKCLKCAKEFLSEHVGERICPMCKVKKGWCWGSEPRYPECGSGMRGLGYTLRGRTLCALPGWKMGTNNWTSLALLVVGYAGLAFTILRSWRQLSDLARRAASKRSSADAAV